MPAREQGNEERMDFRKSKKLLVILAACYWGMVLAVYLVAGVQVNEPKLHKIMQLTMEIGNDEGRDVENKEVENSQQG